MDFCMRIASDLILEEINKGSSSNIVLSPMSISVVLNLVASGSHGETLAQFLKVLGSKDTHELNSMSKQILSLFTAAAAADDTPSSSPSPALPQTPQSDRFGFVSPYGSDMSLRGREKRPRVSMPGDLHVGGAGAKRGKEPVFSTANAIWVDHECSLKSSFKEVSDSVYRALIKNVDLVNEGDKVKEEVNAWAEKNTNGLIKELLSKQVKLRPPLCLANALYFKGTWESPFNVSDTRDQDFHLLNGETTKVPFMMQRNEYYGYASFDDFKLLRLPYERGQSLSKQFSMYVFLPHARHGVKSLAEKLKSDPATFHPKNFRLPTKKISRVWIPKMKFSTTFDAIELMKSEGLTLPFDEGGDFANMVRGGNVYIKMFLHKAFVEVNEEGTEAAAVTFVGIAYGCGRMPPELPSFVADHPFLFMIAEDVSGHVVFSGAVLNPSSK